MHVGLTLRGKNFLEAWDTASLTFSVRRFSKFEILKLSPPFSHCLLLVWSGANNKPSQPVALPLLTKFVFKVISTKAFRQYTVFPSLSICKLRGIKRLWPSFFSRGIKRLWPSFLERRQSAGKVSSGFDPPFNIIRTGNQPRGIKWLQPASMIILAISHKELKWLRPASHRQSAERN